jgi:hypothetical protein
VKSASLCIASALSLLAGCASSTQPVLVRPQVHPNLTIPCPPPVRLPNPLTLGDLVLADAELAAMYLECQAKHRALVEAIK